MGITLVKNRSDMPTNSKEAIDCFEDLLLAWQEGNFDMFLSRRSKEAIKILKHQIMGQN